jgi:phage shock protein PspC (stress-responsive transcriptional regulator)
MVTTTLAYDDHRMSTPPGPQVPPPPFGWAPPPPPPPRPPRGPWRLVRREHGKLLGGVTTGVAAAFGIDVMVVRVVWVIATIASFGLGVAAYAICWIAFPSDEHPAPIGQVRLRSPGHIVGLVLIGIGLLITFGQLLSLAPYHRRFGAVAWALVLIGGGLAVLLMRHPDHDDDPATTHAEAPPTPTAPPDDDPRAPEAEGQHAATETQMTTTAWTQHAPWPTPPTPPWPHAPRPRRPRRPRSFLTPLTLSVLLIGGGVVWLLDNNGTTHFTVAGVFAGGLCVVGVALIVSTWFGRARGLIPLGILLLLVSIPAATIDVPITGGTGKRDYFPVARSELRSKYEFGIGRLEVDLSKADLAGHTSRIRARLGIGEMVIDVPSTVQVVVRAHAGAGSITLFGSTDNGGWPADQTRTSPGTRSGVLYLDLRVGAGHVEVRRFDPTGGEIILPGRNV